MKISYLSDMHLDFHVPFHKNQRKWRERTITFVQQLIETDDVERKVLVIAGDISHFNNQSFWILEEFAKSYELVFFTLGNHDFYLVSKNQSTKYKQRSLNRVNELLTMVEALENVKVLIGFEKHHITTNITIAGDTFWYPVETMDQIAFFHNISNDSQLIENIDISLEHTYSMTNYNKLDSATIIATHIPPITINSHHLYNSTTCYLTPVSELKTHHWVFGHCHEQNVYVKPCGNFYINALGYADEYENGYSKECTHNAGCSIKSFEV